MVKQISLNHALRTGAAGALIALALAACGGNATTTSPTSAASAATSAPAAATSAPAATAAEASAPTAATTDSTAPTAATTTEATSAPAAATSAPAALAKLNLNEVTEDQLMAAIPNFSARMVREFMEYRPYVSIQQFRKEIGKYVSAEEVTAYEQYVYVPVSVNDADAATLQQIPGLDAAAADALIAGRPYASNQAFLEKLASAAPGVDASAAAAYLAAQ